jgi:DNA-binding NarL/FixJ family response regulator
MMYAMLLSGNQSIIAVYVKRPEDSAGNETDIIQLPPLPQITDRQREFMEKLGTGSTIGEMATALGTSRSNVWNLANALQDDGLVSIGKSNESVIPSFPGNVYMKGGDDNR